MNANAIQKIVSGGQTGVDRAALDAAIELNIKHGGWCPRRRLAEDGRIPRRYQLQETGSTSYAHRTEQNVIDSDATLIIFRAPLEGGTALTARLAERHQKPCFLLDLDELLPRDMQGDFREHELPLTESHPLLDELRQWLHEGRYEVLNVAGPRESGCPGIASDAKELLIRFFSM